MDFKSAVVGVTPEANKAAVQAAFSESKVDWAAVGKIDWAAFLAKIMPLLIKILPLFLGTKTGVAAFDWMALLKQILAILGQLFPPNNGPVVPPVPKN